MASINYDPTSSLRPAMGSSRSVSDTTAPRVHVNIREKRKARKPQTCYPCRMRKVKCDRDRPCIECVKRDHTELCSYERSRKRRAIAESGHAPYKDGSTRKIPDEKANSEGVGLSGSSLPSQKPRTGSCANMPANDGRLSIARGYFDNVCTRLKELEHIITSIRTVLGPLDAAGLGLMPETVKTPKSAVDIQPKVVSLRPEGIYAQSMMGECSVHLGSHSTLSFIMSNKTGTNRCQALLEGNTLRGMLLDNESATYPFVNLWSPDTFAYDISPVCHALPIDQQCKELFAHYRDVAGVVYPVIGDMPRFEKTLDLMLRNRAGTDGVVEADHAQPRRPFGVSIAYLGLLFAVLAAGCQVSDLSGQEIKLTSQIYVCCSYQCLRMTNFLSRPTLDAIQTLLVLSNVLSNNMNPGISYLLLGLTGRMGLTLGLHAESSPFSARERYLRRHVWWVMAWEDSYYSLFYDRPSTMALKQPEVPRHEGSTPGELSYFEAICRVISLVPEVLRSRMLSPSTKLNCETIQAYDRKVQKILIDARPYLRDPASCFSSNENLERVVLKLYSSYFLSELCRPVVQGALDISDPLTARIRAKGLEHLITTVKAFVELHTFNPHASRCRMAQQCAIISILLLAVTEDARPTSQFQSLLQNLKTIIKEHASAGNDFHYSTDILTCSDPSIPSPQLDTPAGTSFSCSPGEDCAVRQQPQLEDYGRYNPPWTSRLSDRPVESLERALPISPSRRLLPSQHRVGGRPSL
ncbi:hypothetical protein BJX66DRAFT_330827 [Aspergillus keveii]|uniref:Zn(2)-C6 fungal-type domain-containing protein n=1 Tax=Aspergillus keveii TaxID=714993 RepID=A0ABR4FIM0_9EURO